MRREVLEAAGELLLEVGMTGFTVEKVAARSGASRMTIHKWWPSKGALALDGYFAAVEETLAHQDSGDIAEDLTAQLLAFTRLMRDTPAGRVVPQLIGQAQTDPDLASAFGQHYFGPRREQAHRVLQRAKERGQLRAEADPEVVIDQLWGACYQRLLLPDLELTEEFASALVRNILAGIATSPPGADAP